LVNAIFTTIFVACENQTYQCSQWELPSHEIFFLASSGLTTVPMMLCFMRKQAPN